MSDRLDDIGLHCGPCKKGGQEAARQWYIVPERGPELHNGTELPRNNTLKGAGAMLKKKQEVSFLKQGKPGQVLYLDDNGVRWIDPPKNIPVVSTKNTKAELLEAYAALQVRFCELDRNCKAIMKTNLTQRKKIRAMQRKLRKEVA